MRGIHCEYVYLVHIHVYTHTCSLSVYMQVYEKANSVAIETVHAPHWLHRFIIGRKGQNVQKITQDLPKVRMVSCPARAHLPVRNGLVNKVEFLGLIPQK